VVFIGRRNQTCELISSRLIEAYRAAGYGPTVEITTLPLTDNGNEDMNRSAKSKSDNGLVVIGPSAFRYTEKQGGIQERQEYYIILIYTNNRNNVKLNNELMDITEDELIKFLELQSSVTSDIGGYNSGVHLGVIIAKAIPSF